ncbi:uncharacterized protein LOC143562325 [Bidens hawaiensis]|uniref:uncharacterized protein LOC143562325 n=1 Tax=Bidens hawaiensis TaxID=980011 RepID=UPI00404B1E32
MYCSIKTAKELWESLQKKYKTEDARTKKFVVTRFLDCKMVDFKTVISQVQELQLILHKIHAEGMTLSETFQVAAMIEKLPPSWIDFKNYLKYKRKEMTIDELIANFVEHGQSSKGGGKKGKGRGKNDNRKAKVGLGKKKGAVKKKPPPFQGPCYNFNHTGHRANQCKKAKCEHAHLVYEDGTPLVAMLTEEAAFIEEVNIMGSAPKGWYIDTGAAHHVCGDKHLFKTFKGEKKLYLGNKATADIMGEGDIVFARSSH